jgi:tetratricopeptide (TPR) repeat protein
MAQHCGENLRALELSRSAAGDAAVTGVTKLALDAALCQLAATGALGLAEENERTFEGALALAEELGLRRMQAMVLTHSASARARSRQRPEADARLDAAREILTEIGEVDNNDPNILEATIALDAGNWPIARVLANRAIELFEHRSYNLYPVPRHLDVARSLLGEAPDVAIAACEAALEATRREDTPQYGAVAALCLEQAQLLSGQPAVPHVGGAPETSAEIRATVAENRALCAARQGDWATAVSAFAEAAETWSTLGATIWLVRALVWQSAALRGAGREADCVQVELPIPGLLADLRTPDGVAEAFVSQLTAATS